MTLHNPQAAPATRPGRQQIILRGDRPALRLFYNKLGKAVSRGRPRTRKTESPKGRGNKDCLRPNASLAEEEDEF